MRTRLLSSMLLMFGVAAFANGCSDPAPTVTDATVDVGNDAAPDTSSDTGNDTSTDTAPDTDNDAAADVGRDAVSDIATDTSADVATDAPADTAADAPADVATDVAQDASSDAATDGGLAAACTASGGTVSSSLCCASTGDFPNLCGVGACGCAPASSHTVMTCVCPTGRCFNGTACVTM